MKLGTRPRYSLRMVLSIAKLSANGNPVGLGEVSEHCGISRRYLEQLVTPLKNTSLVKSVSGRGGGYSLSRDAAEITLLDVIEAAIGPVSITDCTSTPEDCLHSDFCNCQTLWTLVNDGINQVLKEYTVKDLLDENWNKKIKKKARKKIPKTGGISSKSEGR